MVLVASAAIWQIGVFLGVSEQFFGKRPIGSIVIGFIDAFEAQKNKRRLSHEALTEGFFGNDGFIAKVSVLQGGIAGMDGIDLQEGAQGVHKKRFSEPTRPGN